ncbi:hypothetical protein OH710_20680 [Pseudomonas capsici]|uniref:hypothetical protein n=1 Tax=Pseudomonas capsici TaxID=2810614 RepID=UPI0021F2301E|nr:hypothetical protein [Pseudomonas capsici]MCV4275062.1 hypothetical protein [Pseudomonas capsici]
MKQRPQAQLPAMEDILKAEEDFVVEFQQFEKQEAIGTLISTLRAAANLPGPPAVEAEYGSVASDEHRSMITASKWYRFGF